MLTALWILNKNGSLIYQRDFSQPGQRGFAGEAAGSVAAQKVSNVKKGSQVTLGPNESAPNQKNPGSSPGSVEEQNQSKLRDKSAGSKEGSLKGSPAATKDGLKNSNSTNSFGNLSNAAAGEETKGGLEVQANPKKTSKTKNTPSMSSVMTSNDRIRLSSTLHGLSAIAAKVSPVGKVVTTSSDTSTSMISNSGNPGTSQTKSALGQRNIGYLLKPKGISCVQSDDYTLYIHNALTGIRFILITDVNFDNRQATQRLAMV